MKGLAGRQTRGLPKGAQLECIDNTGAKVVEKKVERMVHASNLLIVRMYDTVPWRRRRFQGA